MGTVLQLSMICSCHGLALWGFFHVFAEQAFAAPAPIQPMESEPDPDVRLAQPETETRFRPIPPRDSGRQRPPTAGHVPAEPADPHPVSRVTVEGSMLLVDGQPWFPLVIEYSGEPFARLRQLGFNAVLLRQPATSDQLAEARKVTLWLVCPPPPLDQLAAGELTSAHDVVLAWYLGAGLSNRDLPALQRWIQTLRQVDPWPGRPLVGQPVTDQREYSRVLDILIVAGTDFHSKTPANSFDWLLKEQLKARPGTVHWGIIPTQPPASLREQVVLLSEILGPSARTTQRLVCELDSHQIERAALIGLAAGVRGLCFQSDLPFVEADGTMNHRQTAIALLNQVLEAFRSVWAEGRLAYRSGDPDSRDVFAIRSLPQTQLLIRCLSEPVPIRGQLPERPMHKPSHSLLIPGIPEASRAYRWKLAGLEKLPHRRAAGGIRVEIGEPEENDLILFTRDEKMTAELRRTMEAGLQQRRLLAEELIAWDCKPGNIRHAEALHAALDRLAQSATSAESIVAGGTFEHLATTHAAGWRHMASPTEGVLTDMEIVQGRACEGHGCLRMVAASVDGREPDRSPVWILAPPISLTAGDFIRISGWMHVDTATDRQAGLVVSDSMGGQPLALKFGTTRTWNRFAYYRLAPRTQTTQVRFALDGIGEVWLDAIRIERLNVPRQNHMTARNDGCPPAGRQDRTRSQ